MKAIKINKPYEIGIKEVEMPAAKEGEALLKLEYCGICGADVSSYTGNQPFTTYPRIPGHEFSARIISLPENTSNFQVGDIITANPYFNCGTCYSCERGYVNCCTSNETMGVQRDGSFCEYISMPVERIIGGKGLNAKELALIEPFSISYHAIEKAAIKEGDSVLIMGAGPIGLFALFSAKFKGAKVYMADILEGRLSKALELGADGVINTKEEDLSEAVKKITWGNGFDFCVEACGLPETFLACIDSAAFAGSIVLIGNGKRETSFNHSILLKKELKVFGSRNAYTKDFNEVIDLVLANKIDLLQLVSNIYPMEQADEAFYALANNQGDLIKVLVKMG